MSFVNDLKSVGLIEKDSNNDILWTWTYPSISSDIRSLLLKKCGLETDGIANEQPVPFRYCHHHQEWYYLYQTEVFDSDKLSKVRQFVLVLEAKDFNPDKYETLARILCKVYCKTGDPTAILRLFLSVIIKGSCTTEENGTFLIHDFEQRLNLSSVNIKDVILMFGLETILIYTALILKKRIIVYHHKLNTLLSYIRALPALVWHRQNWDVFYPYMELTPFELTELSTLSHYLAGFRDAAVESRVEFYDVFVNLAAIEITVAPHAKDAFSMSKTHKEIAMFMIRQAENENLSDEDVIKEIAMKTREMLSNLKTMASPGKNGQLAITLETIKDRRLAAALENFLWNLAVAEGMVDI